jgi:preprotein translocase subunit SecE
MAVKNEKQLSRSNGTGRAAVAEKEYPVSDEVVSDRGGAGYGHEPDSPDGSDRGGFFDIYKPTQGFYTRVWTGVAYGVIVCWFAYFLYEKLALLGVGEWVRYVKIFSAVAVILGFGLVGYWALALNRKFCDFLIATEGEMKKVNWTSRKEIIGSTKVVIFVMITLAVLLFVVDIGFMMFFTAIGVLKGGGLF